MDEQSAAAGGLEQGSAYKPGESMAVEWALVAHPAVAEVVALDPPPAQATGPIRVFVVPQPGETPGEALRAVLVEHVRTTIGPAAPAIDLRFVESLPKTRTGKVMRWSLDTPE